MKWNPWDDMEELTLDSVLRVAENSEFSCFKCLHFREEEEKGYSCPAFPEGIPISILGGQRRHTKPMPALGQKNKITFQKSLTSESSEDKEKEEE